MKHVIEECGNLGCGNLGVCTLTHFQIIRITCQHGTLMWQIDDFAWVTWHTHGSLMTLKTWHGHNVAVPWCGTDDVEITWQIVARGFNDMAMHILHIVWTCYNCCTVWTHSKPFLILELIFSK